MTEKENLKIISGKERGLRTINSSTESSPPFEGYLDTQKVLNILEKMIYDLEKDVSDETINKVKQTLEMWQIITTIKDTSSIWMISQFEINISVIHRTLFHRVQYLVKTGEWLGKPIKSFNLKIKDTPKIPLVINTYKQKKEELDKSTAKKLYFKLQYIHRIIKTSIDDHNYSVGIFEKPDGIRNMNTLKAWFEDNEIQKDIVSSIKLLSVSNIIDSLTISD